MLVGNLEILLGADPEKFVHNGEEFVSAHGMIKGDKYNPFPVKDGAVQVDGMAVEFNIDPAKDKEQFIGNLRSVMAQLDAMLPSHSTVACPTAEFSRTVLEGSPREALDLGCSPDYNAWRDGAANPKPDGDVTYRTAAGHIHIGWTEGMKLNDEAHVQTCIMLCKQLDLYLGVPSVLYDEDSKRRGMYGKAGAMRIKPYGVEYRVLSNAWLNSEELMSWVYDNTIKAISSLLKNGLEATTTVVDVINSSDKKEAVLLCKKYDIQTPKGYGYV